MINPLLSKHLHSIQTFTTFFRQHHRLVIAVFGMLTLFSCSIEKRRYTSGFHIEHFSGKKNRTQLIESNSAEKSNENFKAQSNDSLRAVKSRIVNSLNTKQTEVIHRSIASITRQSKSEYSTNNVRINKPATAYVPIVLSESKKRSNIHPDAMKSFVSGLLSFGCLFGIIAAGLSNLWLFVGLIIVMLFFAIAAGKFANRAFKDMHYARDSYSGKALAAAGLVMGVLSIAAFIGLMLIVLLGLTFVAFT